VGAVGGLSSKGWQEIGAAGAELFSWDNIAACPPRRNLRRWVAAANVACFFLICRETVLAICDGELDYDDACKAVIAGSLMPV
jgi:hypothetical protein